MESQKSLYSAPEIFGLDPDCTLEAARKFFETLTEQPFQVEDMSDEVEQLRATQQQLMKQQRRLEDEIDKSGASFL